MLDNEEGWNIKADYLRFLKLYLKLIPQPIFVAFENAISLDISSLQEIGIRLGFSYKDSAAKGLNTYCFEIQIKFGSPPDLASVQ